MPNRPAFIAATAAVLAFAQQATLTFETASVKTNVQKAGGAGGFKGPQPGRPPRSCGDGGGQSAAVRLRSPTRRFCQERKTPLQLIYDAYNIQGCARSGCDRVTGAPDWIASEVFDIDARIPENQPPFTQDQYLRGDAPQHLREMLQSLLRDRFGLRMHRETREFQAYALTVAKDGPKLTINTAHQGRTRSRERRSDGDWNLELRDSTMAHLAGFLSEMNLLGRPVVDRTRLEGTFDVRVTVANPDNPNPPAAPPILTAFEETLGLRLEPVRTPVEMFVIDAIQRPTEN